MQIAQHLVAAREIRITLQDLPHIWQRTGKMFGFGLAQLSRKIARSVFRSTLCGRDLEQAVIARERS
jgi:hypothetical protein